MSHISRRLGLPARLTLLVAAVFAVTVGTIAVVLLEVVENRLVADTRANTEAVLSGYVDQLSRGEATIGVVDVDDATGFFYLDDHGEQLTEAEFFLRLAPVDGPVDHGAAGLMVDGPGPHSIEVPVDPLTGEVIETPGDPLGVDVFPVGEPGPVDLDERVVAVAQDLTIGDDVARVGVSSPLRPVQDSLDTLRRALWVVVPLLVAAVGVLSWLTTTRALRPVDAITRRVRAISHTTMGDRVPVPDRNDEIQRLAITMNDMLKRLDRSQQRQRQFVADASHELRSPIAASRAQLDVARADPDAADWPATADVVIAEQEHLTQLVDDLLALSQMDEHGVGEIVDVDLDDIVAAEARRPRDIAVRVTAPKPVRTRGHPGQLTRALRNLLDNAATHAVDDVHLSLTVSEADAVITVDDDGPGIDPHDRERVFQRFTRLDQARHPELRGGTGLGLAIARQVARSHQGDITAGDSPQGGARFTLVLPRQDQHVGGLRATCPQSMPVRRN
ncbi:MAG: HAMP domain-containing protein [Nitriliruptorales bacterium]|nr:HAMP domain-containing protein [Nitriliruptorales bacterium]